MSISKFIIGGAIAVSVLAAIGCSSNQPTQQAEAAPMIVPTAPPEPVVTAAPMAPPMAPDAPVMAASNDPPVVVANNATTDMGTTMVTERPPRADRN